METLDFSKVDQSWTLFLDRDGVINYEKRNGYISGWKDYKLYEDALEALAVFAKIFGRIVIVSNQKGVGRGITKLKDLNEITDRLLALVMSSLLKRWPLSSRTSFLGQQDLWKAG